MALSVRQELALELAFSAGEPLARKEDRSGTAVGTDRGLITALAQIECELIERQWKAVERWLGYMAGAPVRDEVERARLCEDFLTLGWDLQPPKGLW